MAEEVTPPMTNSPEARTPTGEIIDQGVSSESEGPASTAEGGSAAPESYSDFTAPEGQTLDADLVKSAAPIFKELNLSQDQAQKLVDFYTKQTSGTREAAMTAVEKMRSDWVGEIKADKDIGGILDSKVIPEIGRLKDKLPAEMRSAFNAAMDFTGAGDHPAVVKALYKIAQLVNEGAHVPGAAPSPHGQTKNGQASRPTIAGALYPNLPS